MSYDTDYDTMFLQLNLSTFCIKNIFISQQGIVKNSFIATQAAKN